MTANLSSAVGEGKADGGKANCFDLLRLLLALLVLYTHAYVIHPEFGPEWFEVFARGQTKAGPLAVLGFFAVSGFLVAGSYLRCAKPWHFFVRRIFRIFPGFWLCLALTAFVIGPAIFFTANHTLSGFRWSGPNSAASFIFNNATLRIHQWDIAGVVTQGVSLNGSLWSLLPEFCCYLMLAALGMSGLLRTNRAFFGVFTLVMAAYHIVATAQTTNVSHALPTLLGLTRLSGPVLAFLTGSALCVWREHFQFNWQAAAVFLLTTLITLRLGGYALAAPVLIPLVLINLGYAFTCRLPHDFSYGVYIYGAPCQHLLAGFSIVTASVSGYLFASLLVSLLFAAGSWFAIERPAVRLAHRLT